MPKFLLLSSEARTWDLLHTKRLHNPFCRWGVQKFGCIFVLSRYSWIGFAHQTLLECMWAAGMSYRRIPKFLLIVQAYIMAVLWLFFNGWVPFFACKVQIGDNCIFSSILFNFGAQKMKLRQRSKRCWTLDSREPIEDVWLNSFVWSEFWFSA